MREDLLKSFAQHDSLQNWFDEYHEREGLDDGGGVMGELSFTQREAFLKILYERINFALSNTMAVHEPGVNTLIKEGIDLSGTVTGGTMFGLKMKKLKNIFDVDKENKSCQTVAAVSTVMPPEGANNNAHGATSGAPRSRLYGAPPAMGALPISTSTNSAAAANAALVANGMLPGLQFQARQAKVDMVRHGVQRKPGQANPSNNWLGVSPNAPGQQGQGMQPGAGGARHLEKNNYNAQRSNFSTPSNYSSVSPAKRSYRQRNDVTPPNSYAKQHADNVHPAAMVPPLNLSGL